MDSRLDDFVGKIELKILDAGSGITFPPFFLAAKFHSARIDCVDNDPALDGVFDQIKAGGGYSVAFKSADLEQLPYRNNHFDAAYCISVLEHTKEFSIIIREIKPELAKEVLSYFASTFLLNKKIDLENEISHPDIFTSHIAREIDPLLLAWKYPAIFYQVKSLLSGEGIGSWPPF